MADELSNVLAQLGQFATSPQMPVLAGDLGTAMMAPYAARNPKAGVIAGIGQVASGYGKSAIAANEAKVQGSKAAETSAYMKQLLPFLLAGGAMTPPEQLGPSGQNIKINPDGTAKITTDVTAVTQGNNAPAGATSPGQMDPKQATPIAPIAPVVQPTAQPSQGINPRMLPFLLAQSSNSSGGANTNLTGLSPEDISKSVAGNVAGGKLAQDSVQNIFENASKMAYADYLDRLPQAHAQNKEVGKFTNPTYNKETGTIWVIDQNTAEAKDTKIVPDNELLAKLKLGGAGAMPFRQLSGYDKDGNPVFGVVNQGSGAITGPTNQPGSPLPTAPTQAVQKDKEQLAKDNARATALADKIEGKVIDKATRKPIGATSAEVSEFNQSANTPYVYVIDKTVKKGWFSNDVVETYTKQELPPGVTAAKAYSGYKNYIAKGGQIKVDPGQDPFKVYIYNLTQAMNKESSKQDRGL
jgi:hypothetical protein